MDVTIIGEEIKVFAHVITCLSKLGEQLNLEMNVNQRSMVLQTVNSTKSAFVQFTLLSSFFNQFDFMRNRNQKYQLVLKHFMSVFRNLNHIKELRMFVPIASSDRNGGGGGGTPNGSSGVHGDAVVDDAMTSDDADMDAENNNLNNSLYNYFTIETRTDKGLFKTTRLVFSQEDIFSAMFDSRTYPVELRCESKGLNQCLNNFQHTVSEITFTLEQSRTSSQRSSGTTTTTTNSSSRGSNDRGVPPSTNNDAAPSSSTVTPSPSMPSSGVSSSSSDDYIERQIRVSSYMNPGSVDMKNMMKTQVSIDSTQFDFWRCEVPAPALVSQAQLPSVEDPTPNHTAQSSAGRPRSQTQQPAFVKQLEMTFNLKDFKAFLHFCEQAHQPVTIFLDHQGKPIIFESSAANNQNDMEAVCVLATLSEDSNTQSSTQSSTPPAHYTPRATPSPSPARGRTGGRSSVSTFVSTPIQMQPPASTPDTNQANLQQSTPKDQSYYPPSSFGSVGHQVIHESPLDSPHSFPKRSRLGTNDEGENDYEDDDDDRVVEEDDGQKTPKRTRYSP